MTDYLVREITTSGGRITTVAHPEFHTRFLHMDFYVQYEDPDVVAHVPENISMIPFLMNIAPVVWVSGKTYRMAEMDAQLDQSLRSLRAKLREFYPTVEWRGEILADRLVPSPGRTHPDSGLLGILFSGGLDSVYESIRHAHRPQLLIHAFGIDEPVGHDESQARAREFCDRFASDHGHETAYLESNLRWFLNLASIYTATRGELNWWTKVQHAMGYSGLAAPLMAQRGVQNALLGGCSQAHSGHPHGTHPEVSQAIRWAGLSEIRDGSDVSRHERLRAIVSTSRSSTRVIKLRVCTSQSAIENCGVCEKCLRTTAGLVALGEDPRAYGFPGSPSEAVTWLARAFRSYRLNVGHISKLMDWLTIQNGMRERLFQAWSGAGSMPSHIDGLIWFSFFDLWRYRTRSPKIRRCKRYLYLALHPLLLLHSARRRVKRLLARWLESRQTGRARSSTSSSD